MSSTERAARPRARGSNQHGEKIVAKLNRELVRMLDLADVRESLTARGLFVRTSTPEQLGSYMKSEIEKWAKVVKEAGLKLD